MTEIKVADGKYTVAHENGSNLRALRYGEPWRDLVGDGLILALVQEIEDLRQAAQPAASARPPHDLLQQFFDALDDALSKERASPWTGVKREKFRDRMLAWDRVQELRGQLLAAPVAQEFRRS